jgi:anaerobic selenocysteine-containing dehydrogenase
VDWAEILDRIESELRASLARDPRGVAWLVGGGSLGILKGMTRRFFRRLGPVSECAGDICSGAGEAAQLADFGVSDSHDVFDVQHSRSILLWGKNVGVSNIHLVPLLKAAQRGGAEVLFICPTPPEPGLPPHRWIAPHPGRDLELAFGVMRLLFERAERDGDEPWRAGTVELAGVGRLRDLAMSKPARAWADEAGLELSEIECVEAALLRRPASLHVGWGVQRRARGGDSVRALDALAALSGNLGRPGGGVSFYYARKQAFRTELFDEGHEPGRQLWQARLSTELAEADPPVEFLWIAGANPIATLPDSAELARQIERIPFVVVSDTHPNDTTRRAEALLPVETMLEDSDLLGSYGQHYITASSPVLERPAEVRSDLEIIQELAQRFGMGEDFAGSRRQWKERLLRPELAEQGIDVDALEGESLRSPLAEPVLFADGHVPTPSGKVELLDRYVPPESDAEDYPLWLFSNSHRRSQCSQWADGEDPEDPLPVRLHPAASPGIANGGIARLVSGNAALRVRVVHDERLRPDVAIVPKGGSLDLGRSANVLIAPRETDLGGGAAYLDTRVRLEEEFAAR